MALLVPLVMSLVLYVYMSRSLQLIARKTKTPCSWIAWLPPLSPILMWMIGGWSVAVFVGVFVVMGVSAFILPEQYDWILFVLIFLPWGIRVAKLLKKPLWTGVLMGVPGINLIMLGYFAFSKGTAGGTAATDSTGHSQEKLGAVSAQPKPTKLYSPIQVGLASFLGSPLAGSFLLGLNYRRLQKPQAARAAPLCGVLVTILIIVGVWHLPGIAYGLSIVVLYALAMGVIAQRLQNDAYVQHLRSGGKAGSFGIVLGAGVACRILVILLAIPLNQLNASVSSLYASDDQQLIEAAREGELSEVQGLLARGADINAKDRRKKETPLLAASRREHSEVVALLLDKGADVSSQEGRKALYGVSVAGHSNIVELLLAHGADPNGGIVTGRTALHAAASEGHLEAINMLLDAGAEVNLPYPDSSVSVGVTPLIAASHRQPEAVELLLQHGADPNAKHKESNRTALIIASLNGQARSVKALLEARADVNAQDNSGLTPLMLAAREGHIHIVEDLLRHGADVDVKDEQGRTAHNHANKKRHKAIVRLLEGGAVGQ